jgi:uncharacterized Zn-binding protein involved in type VI secretion
VGTVAVNQPKTPVTKGSSGIATATLPNLCKMPPPPPPFCPTPLPNIGQSGKDPKGYSTTVKIEGNPVAIQGASYGSSGDIASKGTGGGVVSSNAEGPTKFIAPGSLNVKIQGKNVQLLGDQMLNNCGPAGSPANSATMGGTLQAMAVAGGANPKEVKCKDKGFSKCEIEEICNKCARINRKVKKLNKMKRSVYDDRRRAGSAAAARLATAAQANPAAGATMIPFQASSQACKDEHIARGFVGTSADHVTDIALGGMTSARSNLRWMSSKANSWMGAVMGHYKPKKHTGVKPDCC